MENQYTLGFRFMVVKNGRKKIECQDRCEQSPIDKEYRFQIMQYLVRRDCEFVMESNNSLSVGSDA
jgi:hypothetical protein